MASPSPRSPRRACWSAIYDGNVISGEGQPEATAFYIHGRLHMRLPRARVAFHTHMPHATALSMVEGDPLVWAGQTALKFYGRTAIDRDYKRACPRRGEGDRIAGAMGDADIVFMKNHGVMVIGPSIAEAWDDLYYLERACEVQVLAMSTGPQADPGRTRYRPQNLRPDAWRRFGERPTASGERQAQSDARGAGIRGLNRAQGTQFMQASMKVASKPPSPAGRDRGVVRKVDADDRRCETLKPGFTPPLNPSPEGEGNSRAA